MSWNGYWKGSMVDADLGILLTAAATDVLETMFFTSVAGEVPGGAAANDSERAVQLRFWGGRSGTFRLRLSASAATVIAANFLADAVPEPSEEEIDQVIREAANMICGSVLSRLDGESEFNLGSPELADPLAAWGPAAAEKNLEVEGGVLALSLQLGGNA